MRTVYKGKVTRTQEAVSEWFSGSCGLDIPKSGAFLVFSEVGEESFRPTPAAGQLYVGGCGGTRALSEGALAPGLGKAHAPSRAKSKPRTL